MELNAKQTGHPELANSQSFVSKSGSNVPTFERHYTIAELAGLWNLSADSVRRLFKNEAGVLSISTRQRRGKRSYLTLRIPASVAERIYRKLSIVRY